MAESRGLERNLSDLKVIKYLGFDSFGPERNEIIKVVFRQIFDSCRLP